MNLDQYKDIFGKPYEGVHQYRIPIIDWALIDVALVALVAYIFYLFGYGNFWLTFVILFILGEIFHYMFGVQTAFIKQMSTLIS